MIFEVDRQKISTSGFNLLFARNSRRLLLSDDETVVEEYEYGHTIVRIIDETGIKRYLFDFSLVIIAARGGTGTEL